MAYKCPEHVFLHADHISKIYPGTKALDDVSFDLLKGKVNVLILSLIHIQMCIRDRNCTYRQFTTGFFYGKPDENTQIYDNNTYQKEYTYLGFAEAVD